MRSWTLGRRILAFLAICCLSACSPGRTLSPPSQPILGSTSTVQVPSSRGPLVRADGGLPASGVCATASGTTATIHIDTDTPAPRCIVVSAEQHLTVTNDTAQPGQLGVSVTITWANLGPQRVDAGETLTFPAPFASYLGRGVHILHVSLYVGDGGAEVWFK
jgi:hypothetical protein